MSSKIESNNPSPYSNPETYNDDTTIHTGSLQEYYNNEGLNIVFGGPLPELVQSTGYQNYRFTNNPHQEDYFTSVLPHWLSFAPYYLKAVIVFSGISLVVSLLMIALGFALTVFTNGMGWETDKSITNSIDSPRESTPNRSGFDIQVAQTNKDDPASISRYPSEYPTEQSLLPRPFPSIFETFHPSSHPSTSSPFPSAAPTHTSSHLSTTLPSSTHTTFPSIAPSKIKPPSQLPSTVFTYLPSLHPTLITFSSAPSTATPSLTPSIKQINFTSFYVIGDRYSKHYEELMYHLARLDPSRGEFLVHLGDFLSGESACQETDFLEYNKILEASPLPVYMVVGDNEWNDCGSSDSERGDAMKRFRSILGSNEDSLYQLQNSTYNVTQKERQPELFSFLQREVLFIGVHVVGGAQWNETEYDDRWNDHLLASIEWVEEQMLNQKGLYKLMVVFGNTRPSSTNAAFFDKFRRLIRRHKIPSLYTFEGDRNKMQQRRDYYWTMEVKGNKFPFVIVTADTSYLHSPFNFGFDSSNLLK